MVPTEGRPGPAARTPCGQSASRVGGRARAFELQQEPEGKWHRGPWCKLFPGDKPLAGPWSGVGLQGSLLVPPAQAHTIPLAAVLRPCCAACLVPGAALSFLGVDAVLVLGEEGGGRQVLLWWRQWTRVLLWLTLQTTSLLWGLEPSSQPLLPFPFPPALPQGPGLVSGSSGGSGASYPGCLNSRRDPAGQALEAALADHSTVGSPPSGAPA